MVSDWIRERTGVGEGHPSKSWPRRGVEVSGFDGKVRRITKETARKRNDLVAALAKVVFVAHAEPGGEIVRVTAQAREWGRPLLTFEERESVEETVGRIKRVLEG